MYSLIWIFSAWPQRESLKERLFAYVKASCVTHDDVNIVKLHMRSIIYKAIQSYICKNEQMATRTFTRTECPRRRFFGDFLTFLCSLRVTTKFEESPGVRLSGGSVVAQWWLNWGSASELFNCN